MAYRKQLFFCHKQTGKRLGNDKEDIMEGIRDALLRMVKAYDEIGIILDAYLKVGLDSNRLFFAQGEVEEAIYELLGEHTEELNQSNTHIVLTAPIMTNERKAEILYSVWKENHPELCIKQPKPNTIEPKEMRKMEMRNGGYMAPEGDWT